MKSLFKIGGKIPVIMILVLIFIPLRLSAQSHKELVREGNLTILNRTGIETGANNPIGFGLEELYHAINTKNGTIETVMHWSETDQSAFLLVGTTENRMVANLLDEPSEKLFNPEGIFYKWLDTRAGTGLIVAGTDERGLMYALLELADRVQAHGLEVLNDVENMEEFPDNKVRGVDRFLRDPAIHSWVLSRDFWEYYLQRLARNRFNRLVVITGFRSAYMTPPYPFLVDVPGFSSVRLHDFVASRQEQLRMLRFIGELCEKYGLDFVFGSWVHGRTGIYQPDGGDEPTVLGLPESVEAYSEYCKKGMRELLTAAPEIDGVQLRVNFESGVGDYGKTKIEFWKGIIESIGEVSRERNKDIFLDLRAKGLTKSIREWALKEGLNLSVATKYTWEATGLPYHTSQMRIGELRNINNLDRRQRYSYADFLYKPRPYDVFYRLWSYGTNRLMVWGDPDYARQFSENAGFGGGTGFEVTPPMSLKKGTWNIFEDQSLIHYDWEDERYWAWYLFFGRLGYNTDTDFVVWERKFKEYFGETGGDMLQVYRTSGKFLPLLTSAHLTQHPGVLNWGEMDTGGALFKENNDNTFFKDTGTTYITVEPGDPGLFYGIDDYVKAKRADTLSAKYTPSQLSDLYMDISHKTRDILSKLDKDDVPDDNKSESRANLLDFAMTADLAAYHSYKIKAALQLCFYQQTGNAAYLPSSLDHMKAAYKEWKSLADRTEKTYNDHPLFPRTLGNSWKGRLKEIASDIQTLEALISKENPQSLLSVGQDQTSMNLADLPATISDNVPETWVEGEDLPVSLDLDFMSQMGLNQCTVYYRHANLAVGRFKRIEMEKTQDGFKAVIPGKYVIPDYDLLIYMGGIRENGDALIYPGLYNPEYSAPYHVVKIKNHRKNETSP